MNVKKLSLAIFACGLALPASLSFATNWIFDYEKYTHGINWSETFGTAGEAGSGYWYYMEGDNRVYIEGGSFASTDTIHIGDEGLSTDIALKVDSDIALAGISLAGDQKISISGDSTNTNKLTVTGDIISTTSKDIDFNNLDLTVTGTLQGGTGHLNMNNMSSVDINVLTSLDTVNGQRYYVSAASGDSASIDNPTVKIGQILHGDGFYFNNVNTDRDLYYSIGNTDVSLTSMQTTGSSTLTTYLILTPQDTSREYSTKYGLRSNLPNNDNWTTLKIIMKGADGAVQNIGNPTWTTSNNTWANGGIEVISGTLNINFAQPPEGYAWDNIAFYTNTAASGGVQTTFSHGDLTMIGGTFGSYAERDDGCYGSFRFTNIVYSGGKIRLRLICDNDGNISQDSIDLTGYYRRDSTDPENLIEEYIAGGTIRIEQEGAKVSFDLGSFSELAWLIDYEDGEFAYGDGAKIVSWDAVNKPGLTESDFYANRIESSGDEYMAKFTLNDDGLYVKYIAVPEPAEWAAIFGIFALAFAYIRRRGK